MRIPAAPLFQQCFWVPLVRHLYHWWGIRPITRDMMRHLLMDRNKCVALVPGGVQVRVRAARVAFGVRACVCAAPGCGRPRSHKHAAQALRAPAASSAAG
jgi:hypothetical protein